MSRIGKAPIKLPAGVELKVSSANLVTVKGPKGELHQAVDADIKDVADIALSMKSTALLQRLGFLADLVGWTFPAAVRARLRNTIVPSTRAVFGREKRQVGDIGYVAAWGLLVHARESELLTDVPRIKRSGVA